MAGELTPTPFLSDALVILGAAGIVIPVFARFRITPIIGFILIGVAVGPFGLGSLVARVPWIEHITITNPEVLTPFADFGIVLLLFAIGLELSFNRLWQLRRLVFGLGALELIIIGSSLAIFLGVTGMLDWTAALALGFALAFSSTAIVLPISGTRTPVGRAALSMLLFEDIMIVPIIFILGALAPNAQSEGWAGLMTTLWQGGLVIAVLLVAGRFALPHLFAQAARTKSPELFLSASLLVVIGASLATALVGLSPIVGALIAGLLIAETEYNTEVELIMEPFKGLALGVFLITIGMSINLVEISEQLGALALAVVGVLMFKALVTGVLLRLMGARRSTAAETGVMMASPSETTLIVLAAATAALVIDTGSQGSIGNLALQRKLRAAKGVEVTSTDVTGSEIVGRLDVPRTLQIGRTSGRNLMLKGLAISYADAPAFAALSLNDTPAMVLGVEDLRLFDRVAIDFAERTVLFDLPKDARTGFADVSARVSRRL